MTDEQRCDSLGCYGSPWAQTPNLDRLAARSVRFDSAYSPSPVCVAARASLLIGHAPCRTGVLNNHQALRDDDARFLTHDFARAGYQTASFGKHHYNNARPAFETQAGYCLGGRVGYTEFKVDVDATRDRVVHYPADAENGAYPWILAGRFPGEVDQTPEAHNVRDAMAWIDQRDTDRPWLLRVSLNAPHTPVAPPAPFDMLIDADAVDLPIDSAKTLDGLGDAVREYLISRAGSHRLAVEQIKRARQAYYGSAAFVDHVLGNLLDQLADRGLLDDTIIAFMSDHGTHLADHGFFQKQSFFEVSARVPWLLALPGQGERVISTPVSTGSLLPTLLDLAGVSLAQPVSYPSLAACVMTDQEPIGDPIVSEIDYGLHGYRTGERYVMVRRDRWKLIAFRQPGEQGGLAADADAMLFDLQADPGEKHNLINENQHASTIEELLNDLARRDAACLHAATAA